MHTCAKWQGARNYPPPQPESTKFGHILIGGEKKHIKDTHIKNYRGPQHKDLRAAVLYVGGGASSALSSRKKEPPQKELLGSDPSWRGFGVIYFFMFMRFFFSRSWSEGHPKTEGTFTGALVNVREALLNLALWVSKLHSPGFAKVRMKVRASFLYTLEAAWKIELWVEKFTVDTQNKGKQRRYALPAMMMELEMSVVLNELQSYPSSLNTSSQTLISSCCVCVFCNTEPDNSYALH